MSGYGASNLRSTRATVPIASAATASATVPPAPAAIFFRVLVVFWVLGFIGLCLRPPKWNDLRVRYSDLLRWRAMSTSAANVVPADTSAAALVERAAGGDRAAE